VSAAGKLVSRSPGQPSDIVAERAATTVGEVERAAARARAAGQEWASANATVRAGALRRSADAVAASASELEALMVREVGKPRLESRGEVSRAVSILHYYAQQVLDPVGHVYPPSLSGLLFTESRPHGVAGLITPWNFPIAIPLWKAAPALAAGNAVLLKPSTEALGCAARLVEILAGTLPADLLTVLPGEGDTGQAVVEASDVVSFTGSSPVGREVAVAATRRGIPVQAEMGGQNAAIVLPDADLPSTAAILASAAMGFAGQKCTATRRVIIVGDASGLTEALIAAVKELRTGDPAAEATVVGPLITEAARDRVAQAAQEAQASGGRILAGGASLGQGGWYVGPTVVDGLEPTHRLAREETFGPLITLVPATSVEEAIRLSNSVRYGLVTSVHGADLEAVLRVVAGLDTGLVKVNAPTTGVDFYLPFGGAKDSSHGPREQGKAGMAFYSSTRTVTIVPGTRRTA